MNLWDLPTATEIDLVFEWCARERHVDRLLLSARLDQDEKKPVLDKPSLDRFVASTFGNRLLERKLVRRWPGTQLIGHDGVVYVIAFDLSLIAPMRECGPRLSDWRHWRHDGKPPLPEDPCLFRQGDDWPVLVSVTHERDAWVLSERRPPFCDEEPSDFDPEDIGVASAAEGFVGD
jgi:hypothetical protein